VSLAVIDRLLANATTKDGKAGEFVSWDIVEPLRNVCLLAAEVGDRKLADALVERLKVEEQRHLGAALLQAVELMDTLPATFRTGGICGNSTEEEFRQFAEEEQNRYFVARTKLIDLHARLAGLTLPERLSIVADSWKPFLKNQYGTSTEPLVRAGDEAVESLHGWKEKAEDGYTSAKLIVVLAEITGTVEREEIESLLAGDNVERVLGCQAILRAGSREFKDELIKLQSGFGDATREASSALASIYRMEAIPWLRAAYAADENNYVAKCAIAELQAWGE
jgi:hypothetical protein